MDKIQQYLEKQDKIIMAEREKKLIELGLTEKEYSPNNKETYFYNLYEYVNGEKHFYRNAAIKVTDEQYALIIKKEQEVKEIEEREAAERLKNRKTTKKITKKWIPVFKKIDKRFYDEVLSGEEKERKENGKSPVALWIQIIFIVLYILAIIGSIILKIDKDIDIVLYVFIAGIFEGIFVQVMASMLDYLAEISAMLRNGYEYEEE